MTALGDNLDSTDIHDLCHKLCGKLATQSFHKNLKIQKSSRWNSTKRKLAVAHNLPPLFFLFRSKIPATIFIRLHHNFSSLIHI